MEASDPRDLNEVGAQRVAGKPGLVAQQHAFAGMAGETLRDGGAGKAGADDEIIEHNGLSGAE